MNLKDAIDTVVDYIRTQSPDDPKIDRAVKRLEQRSDRLRELKEARLAPIPPDLLMEPLTIESFEIAVITRGEICRACFKKKERRASLCPTCYLKLPTGIRKALWRADLYDHAFCRALRLLRELGGSAPSDSDSAPRRAVAVGEARREVDLKAV